MIRRRAIVACAVVLALLGPVGNVPAEQAGGPRIGDVPSPIIELLEAYGRGHTKKDGELLASTIAGALVEPERRALANAQAVTFESFDVRPITQYSGNLASPRIRRRYAGRDVATYHVLEETRVSGETDTYVEDGAFTFVREDGRDGFDGWRLESKDDLDALGFFSPYHLWDEGRVVVLRSDRFILLTHPDVADAIRPVLEIAENAYDRVARFWPRQLRDRYVIVVPETTAELGRIFHETVDLDKFVAFVSAGAERDDGWEPTGPRMFVHLSHLRSYPPAAQTEIITHELIHAVTREVSGPNVPTWIEEGLANVGSGGFSEALATEGPTPDDFPTDDLFVTGPVRGIQAVYAQSQVALDVLADETGRDGLAEFYEELGSRRVVVGTEDYHVKRAIEESTDWSYEDWLGAWRKRLG